ncbi:Uncharacterized protein TCM_008349 [Theobroma cacao]|uniref:Uncharacterized protein n=1 Tax=Theobroma cacao TaxID=3641 RepID=A0A061EBH3_THECC|nr:Uncharacterized protein TCM_008349 [Theobroma cacao]
MKSLSTVGTLNALRTKKSFKAKQSLRLQVMQRLHRLLLPQSALPPTKMLFAKGFNMTAPVLVTIHPPTGPHLPLFVLRCSLLHAPKMPKNPLSLPTQLKHTPQHEYAAVRRFGGLMDDSIISALKATAWESSIPYRTNTFGAPLP